MAKNKCGKIVIGGITFDSNTAITAITAVRNRGLDNDGLLAGLGVLQSFLDKAKINKVLTLDEFTDYFYGKLQTETSIKNKTFTMEELAGFDDDSGITKSLLDLLNLDKYKDLKTGTFSLASNVVEQIHREKKNIIENGPLTEGEIEKLYQKLSGMKDVAQIHEDLTALQVKALKNKKKGSLNNLPLSEEAIKNVEEAILVDISDILAAGLVSEMKTILTQLGQASTATVTGFDSIGRLAEQIVERMEEYGLNESERVAKESPDDSGEIKARALELFENPLDIEQLKDSNHDRRFARDILSKATLEAYEMLDLKDLIVLEQQRDNIENGYLLGVGFRAIRNLQARNVVVNLTNIFGEAKIKKYSWSRAVAKIQNIGSELTVLGTVLNTHPLYMLDQFLGNKAGKEIYHNMILNLGQANQKFIDRFRNAVVERDLQAQHMAAYLKEEGFTNAKLQNETVKQNVQLELYFQQRLIENNQDHAGYTLDHQVDNVLKSSKKKYAPKTKDIVEDVWVKEDWRNKSAQDMYDALSQPNKDSVKWNDDWAEVLLPMHRRNASVRGESAKGLNYYHHTNSIDNSGQSDDDVNVFKRDLVKRTLKQGSLAEKTHGKNTVINLLSPLDNVVKAVQMTTMDFYLTPQIKISLDAAKMLAKDFEGHDNADATEITEALAEIVEKAIDIDIANKLNIEKSDTVGQVISWLEKVGYTITLLSVQKAVAEVTGNLTHIMVFRPNEFLLGVKSDIIWDKTGLGLDFIRRSKGSDVQDKLYGENLNQNSHIRDNLFEPKARKITQAFDGQLADTMAFAIEGAGGKKAQWLNDQLASMFFTTTERMLALPLFWGTFLSEFKAQTNIDMTPEMMRTIADNENAYLEHQEAIEYAMNEAGDTLKYHTAPTEHYAGTVNLKIDKRTNANAQLIKSIQVYMQRFQHFEYASMLSGWNSAWGEGPLDREKGVRLLLAGLLRQTVYFPILFALQGLFAKWAGEEQDEDDETFLEDVRQNAIMAMVNMIIMRNLLVGQREILGQLIEWGNRTARSHREGGDEYDPWKHSLAFTVLGQKDLKTGNLMPLTGPWSPLLKLIQKQAKGTNRDVSDQIRDFALNVGAIAKVVPFHKNIAQYFGVKDRQEEQKPVKL